MLKTVRNMAIAALIAMPATLGASGQAAATVLYQFNSPIGDFSYTSADFITSFLAVPTANLDSSSTPFGTIDYAQFQPNVPGRPNNVEIILTTSGAGNLFTYFNSTDFTTYGAHSDVLLNRGATLTVSAVPEPATWAMLILGFLGLGVLARRRRARSMPQTA